jgi:hypothetical protein
MKKRQELLMKNWQEGVAPPPHAHRSLINTISPALTIFVSILAGLAVDSDCYHDKEK